MMRQLKKLPTSVVVVAVLGANVTLKKTGEEICSEEKKKERKGMKDEERR